MGFLSGVLGAVKNDDAVKTYDVNRENKLSKVLTTLNNNIGKGSKGLHTALGDVAWWLRDYEIDLLKKTERVTDSLNKLKEDLSGKYYKQINASQDLSTQLANWTLSVGQMEKHVNYTVTYYINFIDQTLKTNVMHELKSVQAVIAHLKSVATDNNIVSQARQVDNELLSRKAKVVDKINAETTAVHQVLDDGMHKILGSITKLYAGQDEKFGRIMEAICMTRDNVDREFGVYDNSFKSKILKFFHDIRWDLKDLSIDATDKMSRIHREVHIIRTMIGGFNDDLHGKIRALQNWMNEAIEFIEEVKKRDVKKVIDEANEPGGLVPNNKQMLRNAAEQLKQQADQLYSSGHAVTSGIETWVTSAQQRIKDLEDTYRQELWRIKEAVTKAIGDDSNSGVLGSLTTLEEDVKRGLGNVRNDIKKKLETFGEQVWKALEAGMHDAKVTWPSSSAGNPGVKKLASMLTTDMKAFGELMTTATSRNTDLSGTIEYILHALNQENKKAVSGDVSFDKFQKTLKSALSTAIDKALETVIPSSDYKFDIHAPDGLMKDYRIKTKVAGGGSNPQEGELRTAIKDIIKPLSSIERNTSGGIQTITVGNIETINEHTTAYNTLHQSIEQIKDGVIDALRPIEEGRKNALTHFSKVKTHLADLCSTISNAGEGIKFNLDNLKIKITGNGETQLGGIKDNIYTMKNTCVKDVTAATNNVSKLIEELEKVPDIVVQSQTEVERIMEKFAGDMSRSIKYVEAVVGDADRTLKDLINAIDKDVRSAYGEIQHAVDVAKGELLAEVQTAFAIVTDEIQELFANSHLAHLSALKSLLSTQLKIISCAIDKNLNTGLKGFLKTLSGVAVTRTIDGLKVQNSTKNLLDELKNCLPKQLPHDLQSFIQLSGNLRKYLDPILFYTHDEIMTVQPPSGPDDPAIKKENDASHKLDSIKYRVDDLLDYLKNAENKRIVNGETIRTVYLFDNKFVNLLSTLSTSLTSLTPSAFANPRHPELLDAVRQGLEGFVKEMERVYVNGYDNEEWNKDYENEYAKILLTTIETLLIAFDELSHNCASNGSWQNKKIHFPKNSKNDNDSLGAFFKRCGYNVSDSDAKQNGELDKEKSGNSINGIIAGKDGTLYPQNRSARLNVMLYHLHNYRRVCHLIMRPKPHPPTTINQMLHWLAGLHWNPMYSKVEMHIPKWYSELTADYKLATGDMNVAVPFRATASMKGTINHKHVKHLFNTVTIRPYHILVRILGHGHAGGRYACDFYTNVDNLDYPASASSCLDMFIEICLRLNYQLRFLYKQCENYTKSAGWRDCWYGQGVGGSGWQCNEKQCPNQICNQTHNQMDDQHPMCGVKSPLQSFLEDGLPGFLPHPSTKIGCGITCSMSNHRGTPCITPMGFRDLSITASHTKKGDDIRNVLAHFCGPVTKPLSMLCAIFTCLTRKPPQDLGDMFSFYHNFLEHWSDKGETHKKTAFDDAIKAAYFGNEYTLLNPAKLQVSSMHGSSSGTQTHLSGDLFTLLSCNPENTPPPPCGQYLQPMCLDIRCAFTSHHASLYLSWVVYLTETFYLLLKKLRDEFCRQCNAPSSKCHGSKCVKTCGVKYTEGGAAETQIANQHNADCSSITNCFDAHATMYSCGFTFGSPYKLSGTGNSIGHKRTCKDFL